MSIFTGMCNNHGTPACGWTLVCCQKAGHPGTHQAYWADRLWEWANPPLLVRP